MQGIHALAHVRQSQGLSQAVGAVATSWPVQRGGNPVSVNEIHRERFGLLVVFKVVFKSAFS
jgi:hypothetical protein